MLGRKQSIRADIMAPDYVQDESLNENAEIDWVNKVNTLTISPNENGNMDNVFLINTIRLFSTALGPTVDAFLRATEFTLRQSQYSKNF